MNETKKEIGVSLTTLFVNQVWLRPPVWEPLQWEGRGWVVGISCKTKTQGGGVRPDPGPPNWAESNQKSRVWKQLSVITS